MRHFSDAIRAQEEFISKANLKIFKHMKANDMKEWAGTAKNFRSTHTTYVRFHEKAGGISNFLAKKRFESMMPKDNPIKFIESYKPKRQRKKPTQIEGPV
jgi:hypothetical protein